MLMIQTSLLVFAAAGTTYQMDIHMAYFAGLAIAAFWCCPTTILMSAAFVAVHHLVLNLVYPPGSFRSAPISPAFWSMAVSSWSRRRRS